MEPESSNEPKVGDQRQARTRRFFTPGDKAKIVMESFATGNPSQAMKDRGIHPNVFYRWRTTFIEGGTKALGGEEPTESDADEVMILREQNLKLKTARGELYIKLRDYEQAEVGNAYQAAGDDE
ncbi:MAG: transposase [Armatimonadota bacterium]